MQATPTTVCKSTSFQKLTRKDKRGTANADYINASDRQTWCDQNKNAGPCDLKLKLNA